MSDIASLGIKVESNLKTLNKDMEKTISLSEKVTDATKKMESQMAGVSSTTKNVITEEVKRQRSVDNLIKSLTMQEIRLKEGKIGLDNYKASLLGATDAEKKQIAVLNTSIKTMQDANKTTKSSMATVLSFLQVGSGLFVFSKISSTMKAFVSDVLEVTKSTQSMKIALNAATGGAMAGTEAFSFLRAESERLGLVFNDQVKGFSRIAAAAKGTALEGEGIREVYSSISEASTVLQLSSDDTMGVLKAVSDMMSKGTIQAEELRGQLGDRLPGAFQLAADAMSMTTEELTRQLKAGKVISEDFLPKFAKAMKEQFAGSVDEASKSIQANLNRMENSWEQLKRTMYSSFNDDLNNMIIDTTNYIKKLTDRLADPDVQKDIKDITEALKLMADVGIEIGELTIYLTKALKPIKDLNDAVADGLNPWKAYTFFLKKIVGENGDLLKEENKNTKDFLKNVGEQWNEWEKESDAIFKKREAKKPKAIERDEKEITKMIESLKEENDQLTLSADALIRKQAALQGATKDEADLMASLVAKNQAVKDADKASREAESERERAAEKAIADEKARQGRVDAIINKMKEQIATYKQATEVSAEYQLIQEGASPAEIQLAKDLANTIDALKAKTKAQEAYNKVMDKTASDPIELNREKSIEAVNQAVKDGAVLNGTYAESLAQINKHFDKLEMDKSDKALKEMGSELDKLTKFDGSSFGNTIADGINNAMISMNKLNDTFDNNAKAQALIIKLQKEISTGKGSPEERKEKLEQIDKAESKMIENQISGYRQLFGTASQLFKENSREREVMHNIEMAFAAAEIAMNLEKTISAAYLAIAESGTLPPPASFAAIAAMTALMAGIVAAAGGSLSGGGSASAPSVAPTPPQSTALGSTEQSQSISSSFEFLQDIESGQYNELKDISTSMKDLNKNITGLITSIVRTGGISDFAGVDASSGGTSSLQDASTKGFLAASNLMSLGTISAAQAISSITKDIPILGNITSGLSDWLNNTMGSISGAVFGGSKKTSVLASGLQVTPGSIGSGDVSTQAYADIKVKKEGGLFGSDKTYFKTLTEDVDQSVSDMMTKVFKNMGQTMVDIAKGLGTDNLEEVFNYVFDIGKIDLKGLDTEGINKAIAEALSTASDSAAATLFGELIGQYQQIGEGILDTAVRLIADKAIVADVLKMTGQGFADSNIPAKALEVSESLIELAGGLDNLIDSSAAYYDKFFSDSEKQERLYGQLSDGFASLNLELPKTREGYRDLVEAQDLNTLAGQKNYIALLGLAEGSDKYYTTLEEGSKATKDAIQAEIDLSNTRKEAVKKAERSLTVDLLTAQGRTGEALALSRKIELESMDELLRPMKLRIWALQDEAKNTELANKKLEEEKKAAQDAQKALEDLAKARKSELETLIKNTVQAQIDGYQAVADAANEALSKAEGLLTRSFEAEKSRLTAAHEQILKSLTKNVEDAQIVVDNLKSTFDSLGAAKKAMVLSGTSQISYKMAQDQLFSAVGMAKQGDFSGASAVAADTSALTQDTMGFYSSFEDYQREFFKTKNAITELESLTGNELSVQETMVAILQNQLVLETASFDAQIKKLDDQLDGILNVDKSVINLTDAITQYQDAQNAADGANENLKKQTAILNNMMTTLFNTGVVTGNLYSLVDEYTHPEKYAAPTKITTVATADEQKTTNEDLIRQVKILTDTVERGNYAIAKNTQATAKTVDKIYVDGAGTI